MADDQYVEVPQEPLRDAPPAPPKPGMRMTQEEEEDNKTEAMAQAYVRIMGDPRYVQLAKKYCPSLFSVQMVKNVVVDPAFLPGVGLLVKAYRSAKIERYKDTFSTTAPALSTSKATSQTSITSGKELPSRSAPSPTELTYRSLGSSSTFEHKPMPLDEAYQQDGQLTDSSFESMTVSLQAEAKVRHVALGVDALFTLLPVIGLLPTTGAGSYASTGAKVGLKVGSKQAARRTTMARMDKEQIEAEIFRRYDLTKAFLIYLGQRKNSHPLFVKWEESRLYLKQAFGSHESDHLPDLRPTQREIFILQEMEREKKYDMEFIAKHGKTTLWLLWRVYECWDQLYYDRLKAAAKDKQLYEEQEEQRNMNYCLKYVLKHLHPVLPNMRRLQPIEARTAVELLIKRYREHPHYRPWMHYSGDDEKTYTNAAVFFEPFLEQFFDSHQVWGLEGGRGELIATALVERAGEKPVTGVIMANSRILTSHYGLNGFRKVSKTRSAIAKARTKHNEMNAKNGEDCNYIHFIGYDPSGPKQGLEVYEYMLWALARLDNKHATVMDEYMLLDSATKSVMARQGYTRTNTLEAVEMLRCEKQILPPTTPPPPLDGVKHDLGGRKEGVGLGSCLWRPDYSVTCTDFFQFGEETK